MFIFTENKQKNKWVKNMLIDNRSHRFNGKANLIDFLNAYITKGEFYIVSAFFSPGALAYFYKNFNNIA